MHSRGLRVFETLIVLLSVGALAVIVGYTTFGVAGIIGGALAAWAVAAATSYVPPHLIIRLRGGLPLHRWRAPGLFALVDHLALRAGIPTPRLYVVDNPEANAMAAGWRFGPGALAITEGALHLLEPDELEAVLAHEIAHLRNRDSSILRLSGSMAQVSVWVLSVAAWLALGAAVLGIADVTRALVLVALALVIPIGFQMLQAWLSRTRELAADDTAVDLTGRPRSLASALLKLKRQRRFWELWRPRPQVPDALRSHPELTLRVRRLLAR